MFDRWETEEVKINDIGLERYINLEYPILHSGGKHQKRPFGKYQISIVERLINKMMRGGRNTGKKCKAHKIVKKAFEIIHDRTNENPLQVLVNAIENAGPREEVVRLKYGGISVLKAVDTTPQRRIDQALMNIAKGAQKSAFKSKRPIEECLASEIIGAARYDTKVFSIAKKDEKERVAKASR
ncbi:MAG: 30S ribosomal protein S7 [Candidatus Syntropharchaeia archaeon]